MSESLINKPKPINVLIGCTASVAAIKLYEIIDLLLVKFKNKINICVVTTENSQHFLRDFKNKLNLDVFDLKARLNLIEESNQRPNLLFAFTDQDEWASWNTRGDPVLHIELRKWSDIFLIAPLDANTLAKISNGICDNLLTCIIRAWDLEETSTKKVKPVIVCPAMNSFMYQHPLTEKQLNVLINDFHFSVIKPIEKVLMCGDKGIGAMADVKTIGEFLEEIINNLEKQAFK